MATARRHAQVPGVDFMLVGTARSGTTLAQRLACELDGVHVPHETHFFNRYAPDLLARRRFPLDESELRAELRCFQQVDTSHGLPLDVERVVELLGGRAESALVLFAGVVRALSEDATVLGEKTPEHLLWWEPLTSALPDLRIVGIVRDPRAVVASQRHVEWGIKSHALLATQWALDQRELLRAREQLGSERFLLLRYEDMVSDPDAARSWIARFLGMQPSAAARPEGKVDASSFVLPWEHWKAGVAGPVTRARCDAWRRELTPPEIAEVSTICADELHALGYGNAADDAVQLDPSELPEPDDRARLEALHQRRMAGIAFLTERADWSLGDMPLLPVSETPYGRHEWESPATAAAG